MSNKRSAPESGPSKRARFASPSHLNNATDDFLEDDVVQLKKSKNRTAIQGEEGYDSDSTDDGEGVVNSRKGKKTGAGAEADDDDDMFGDGGGGDDEEKGKGDKGKEKESYMKLGDVEGQEFGAGEDGEGGRSGRSRYNANGDTDSEYDSEEEARQIDQSKGLDGSMGFELTAFNVKAELTEGRMTADGEAFITNDADPHEQYDKWLDGMDRSEVKKARRAKRELDRLDAEREKKEAEADASGDTKANEHRIIREVVGLLDRGETVMEGLQRTGAALEKERKKVEASAGPGGKKKTWAEKQKERKAMLSGQASVGSATSGDVMDVDSSHPATKESTPSNPFSHLSDLVTSLTTLGHLDVYSMTKESLQRMLPPPPRPAVPSAGPAGAMAPPPGPPRMADTRAFEYRFSKAYIAALPVGQRPVEREVFGPFPLLSLLQWRSTGFFGGPACDNVELRVKNASASGEGEQNGPWGSWGQVVETGMPPGM